MLALQKLDLKVVEAGVHVLQVQNLGVRNANAVVIEISIGDDAQLSGLRQCWSDGGYPLKRVFIIGLVRQFPTIHPLRIKRSDIGPLIVGTLVGIGQISLEDYGSLVCLLQPDLVGKTGSQGRRAMAIEPESRAQSWLNGHLPTLKPATLHLGSQPVATIPALNECHRMNFTTPRKGVRTNS